MGQGKNSARVLCCYLVYTLLMELGNLTLVVQGEFGCPVRIWGLFFFYKYRGGPNLFLLKAQGRISVCNQKKRENYCELRIEILRASTHQII